MRIRPSKTCINRSGSKSRDWSPHYPRETRLPPKTMLPTGKLAGLDGISDPGEKLNFFFLPSDDSLKYEYPFELKLVTKDGSWCSRCPWHCFCRGCSLPCSSDPFDFASSNLAIDWDQTALHLRYLSAQERVSLKRPQLS